MRDGAGEGDVAEQLGSAGAQAYHHGAPPRPSPPGCGSGVIVLASRGFMRAA
jgi:hypothetical protein